MLRPLATLFCSLLPALVAAEQGRLLATGGASSIDGAAGGGIVPWAVLAGYGEQGEWGGAAFLTRVETGDYRLDVGGAALAYDNRVELSFARQRFDLGTLARDLRLPDDSLSQDIFGVKLRLFGDLIYDRLPQLSLGVEPLSLLAGVTGARVLAFNARGLGGASRVTSRDDTGLDRMVADFEEARRALGAPRWLWWGMSAGGYLGQLYAHRHPDAFAGLLLDSTAPCFRDAVLDPASILSPAHPRWRPGGRRAGRAGARGWPAHRHGPASAPACG